MTEYNDKIIVALDKTNGEVVRDIIYKLPDVDCFKIGTRLILDHRLYEIIKLIQLFKKKIFLDFKLFDINETVIDTIKVMADMGIDYTTVHSTEDAVMQSAVIGAYGSKLKILAVSILTNLKTTKKQVLDRAKRAVDNGCHGLICSAQEAAAVRKIVPPEFLIVCPGIRLDNMNANSHERIMNPINAIKAGADYLVIGRPIINAENPKKIFDDIIFSLQKS